MKKLFLSSLALAASLAMAGAQSYTVNLAPVGGAATGTGSGILTLTGNILSYNISFSGLSGNSSVAHIHGPLPATGVVFGLNGTFGATSGTLSGSSAALTGGQLADLNAGNWYVNVHSGTFPGGEISGIVVPEPSSMALIGLGLAGLLAARRRRS